MVLLSELTRSTYEKHAAQFDIERHKVLVEQKWLDKFCSLCPDQAQLLDVGCGSAEPIAKYLIEKGYHLTGIDFSQAMIDICSKRFPEQNWFVMDMRELDLEKSYDGIISWHSFFHLTQEAQRKTLKIFARHLNDNGVLMLTVGPEAGEVVGHVCGDEVYHSSLSFEEYQQILNEEGITVVEFVREDPECDLCTILLAKKED